MKIYEVRFRPRARQDLIALDRYLSNRFGVDPTERYIQRLEAACLSLSNAPQRGRLLATQVPGLRVLGFERRVSILFQIGEGCVEILRVLYGGRDAQAALDDLPKS